MSFGTNSKAISLDGDIDESAKIIILNKNDIPIKTIETLGSGSVMSKNDRWLFAFDVMDCASQLFDLENNTKKEMDILPFEAVMTSDGSYIVTDFGQIVSTRDSTIQHIQELEEQADGIHIFDDEKILAGSTTGFVGLYNFKGETIWKKEYENTRARFAILNSNLIVVYTENKIECLDLNGQVLWDRKIENRILVKKMVYYLTENNYVVFQTEDNVLHVYDRNGQEIISENIGEIHELYVGGNSNWVVVATEDEDIRGYYIEE